MTISTNQFSIGETYTVAARLDGNRLRLPA